MNVVLSWVVLFCVALRCAGAPLALALALAAGIIWDGRDCHQVKKVRHRTDLVDCCC